RRAAHHDRDRGRVHRQDPLGAQGASGLLRRRAQREGGGGRRRGAIDPQRGRMTGCEGSSTVAIARETPREPVAEPDGASRRRIWLCADDYGLAPGVNGAIRDLVMRGRVNATTVMVVSPSFTRSEALSLGILNAGSRRVAIGLHLTFTAPFRPLNHDFTPLADRAFPPLQDLMRASLMRKLDHAALAAETTAQLAPLAAAF